MFKKAWEVLNNNKVKHFVITSILVLYAAIPLLSPAVDSASFRHVLIVFALVVGAIALYKFTIRKRDVLYLLLWVEALVATALSVYVSITSASVTYLLFAVMVVGFANICYSAKDIKFFVDFYIGFALLIATLIILSWIANIPHTPGCYSVGILGITKNPNYLNSVIVLGASFLMYRLTCDSSLRQKIVYSLILAIMVFGCMQTGTRAAILTLALCGVIVIVYHMERTGLWKKVWSFFKAHWLMVSLVVILAITLGVVLFDSAPATIKRKIIKLFSDNLRLEMWLQNFVEYMKQPILGMGLNATTAFTETLELPVSNIHNTLLQFLCEQGLLGIVFISMILRDILHRARKQDIFVILLMCFAMYVPILFQNNLTSNTFWWPLVFLEVFTRVSEREGLDVK